MGAFKDRVLVALANRRQTAMCGVDPTYADYQRGFVAGIQAAEMVVRALDEDKERVSVNIFDQEELHEDCTVQILRNSITGEVSVGWWKNE